MQPSTFDDALERVNEKVVVVKNTFIELQWLYKEDDGTTRRYNSEPALKYSVPRLNFDGIKTTYNGFGKFADRSGIWKQCDEFEEGTGTAPTPTTCRSTCLSFDCEDADLDACSLISEGAATSRSTTTTGDFISWVHLDNEGSAMNNEGGGGMMYQHRDHCTKQANGAADAMTTFRVLGSPQGYKPSKSSSSTSSTQPAWDCQEELRSTLMVCNLDAELSQEEFVKDLEALSLAIFFDFVYMPMNQRNEKYGKTYNFCYAFVNCTSHANAMEAMQKINSGHGRKNWICNWSKCQGLTANVERYRNSSLMHKSVPDVFKPWLFDDRGNRVPFPRPTKSIPKPRIHTRKEKDNS